MTYLTENGGIGVSGIYYIHPEQAVTAAQGKGMITEYIPDLSLSISHSYLSRVA